MSRLTVLGAIAGIFVLLGCNPRKPASEADARKLAAEALARYCETEKLSPGLFRLTKIQSADDSEWTVVYLSSGVKPMHEVVVDIDQKGNLNVGRFLRDDE